jgi:hypothetical protein
MPRRRRSRIARFKAPFIVSVPAPAALGWACGGRTETDNRGVDSVNPPSSGGSSGTLQPRPNTTPTLAGGRGGRTSSTPCSGKPPAPSNSHCGGEYRCVAGEWKETAASCDPPPVTPTCPATEPDLSTPCPQFGGGMTCDYEYCYGLATTRRCSYATGLWESLPLPSCNPPECPDEHARRWLRLRERGRGMSLSRLRAQSELGDVPLRSIGSGVFRRGRVQPSGGRTGLPRASDRGGGKLLVRRAAVQPGVVPGDVLEGRASFAWAVTDRGATRLFRG